MNNELHIFNDSKCSESYDILELSSQEVAFNFNKSNSTLQASFIEFANGEAETEWIAYFPSAILVPTFQIPIEIIGLVSYVLALSLSVYAAYKEVLKVMKRLKGAMILLTSQILWIIWVILNIIDWTIIYSSDSGYKLAEAIYYYIYNISTLLSVSATFSLVLDFYSIRDSRQRNIRFFILFATHIALAGAVPIIFIFGKIVYLYGYIHKITSPLTIYQQLVLKSPIMGVLVPYQILNTIMYGVLIGIVQYTSILENDRNAVAWNGLVSFSMITHEVLNCWIKNFINKLLKTINVNGIDNQLQKSSEQLAQDVVEYAEKKPAEPQTATSKTTEYI
ncbi:hypothetical protein HDV06_003050 [Boothiomyces sp. JEL0866]|nr:hypothetical protein HDV06_006611 [Boothiomyces sp. JEL0866]KAJ3322506.1 hypothetical protein HDV06_003050 [Boothiomyces sp. JEL0866]